jgi:hypothetical protein
MAANGLLRYGMSAAFPLFTIQSESTFKGRRTIEKAAADERPVYNRMGIDWATSFLGFVSLLMLPIPWVLFKWGSTIRSKSHYETLKS